MADLLDQIPGLREAVEKENHVRTSAFLPLTETVEGFDLLPMTLRHLLALRSINSPLLAPSVPPSPLQLVAFLWLLNPAYTTGDSRVKRKFLKRCRAFVPRPMMFEHSESAFKRQQNSLILAGKILHAARNYVEETFMDMPGQKTVAGYVKSYFSDAAYLCAIFAREFGWDDELTMGKPLKRIFQYLKEMKAHGKAAPVLFNPSDRLVNDYLRQKNAANGGRN